MPKNTVTDPITDQEIAFAHLVLSGTMTDRRAAEAVGLNPDTAAYTKAKPRVRAYMLEHRAAVREKLVDREAQGLRKLNIGRDQILDRLWELATLSHEVTRGSIAGQIKALTMIAAIEGLIPDRRLSPSGTQPAAQPIKADIYQAEWLRQRQRQSTGEEPGDPMATVEAQTAKSPVPEPEPAPNPATAAPPPSSNRNFDPNQPSRTDPLLPQGFNWVPLATNNGFDAALNPTTSLRQPFSIKKDRFGRRR
jgi:hypothetical protein